MTQKELMLKKVERIENIEAMHQEGKSFEEIGKELGISRQRVHSLLRYHRAVYGRQVTSEQCVYKGIRDFLNMNGWSVTDLVRNVAKDDEKLHSGLYNTISNALKGRSCRKQTIDRILSVTGLTYEQAFGEGGE